MGWFFGGGGAGGGGGGRREQQEETAPTQAIAPPAGASANDYRRVKVHKLRRVPRDGASSSALTDDGATAVLAGLVPALADLSLAAGGADARGALDAAAAARRARLAREQAHAEELVELRDVYDMSKPSPVDREPHPDGEGWKQEVKPTPTRVKISRYQAEMINYQRMLMRKNIWYYRDRAGVPRGPCPLHVLKDCWVQGVVDENTLVWGHGLVDWLPARNVTLLVPLVRTPEVRVGAWLKKTFALKPALERARERRPDARPGAAGARGGGGGGAEDGRDVASRQVERMR